MLTDELDRIGRLTGEFLEAIGTLPADAPCFSRITLELSETVEEVIFCWRRVLLSAVSEFRLRRYARFHQTGIHLLLDTLYPFSSENERAHFAEKQLIKLLCFQQTYFKKYLDPVEAAPPAYAGYFLFRVSANSEALLKRVSALPPSALRDSLCTYIREMSPGHQNGSFTYQSLDYYQEFLHTLLALPGHCGSLPPEQWLSEKLALLNFNHLGYFSWCCQQTESALIGSTPAAKLELLKEHLLKASELPKVSIIYDPRWPSIKEMLTGRLKEILEEASAEWKKEQLLITRRAREKLALNLSVAHLALFLRLFAGADIFRQIGLSTVFRFVSRHYTTIRQEHISPGSLSKEYYSTNQVTAAVVRGMLQKMIARINADFFPVFLAAGAAVAFAANIR